MSEHDDAVILCDIETRYHKQGIGTAMLDLLADKYGEGNIYITGMLSDAGFALLAHRFPQTTEGIFMHGKIGTPAYLGLMRPRDDESPLSFVYSWDDCITKYPL